MRALRSLALDFGLMHDGTASSAWAALLDASSSGLLANITAFKLAVMHTCTTADLSSLLGGKPTLALFWLEHGAMARFAALPHRLRSGESKSAGAQAGRRREGRPRGGSNRASATNALSAHLELLNCFALDDEALRALQPESEATPALATLYLRAA